MLTVFVLGFCFSIFNHQGCIRKVFNLPKIMNWDFFILWHVMPIVRWQNTQNWTFITVACSWDFGLQMYPLSQTLTYLLQWIGNFLHFNILKMGLLFYINKITWICLVLELSGVSTADSRIVSVKADFAIVSVVIHLHCNIDTVMLSNKNKFKYTFLSI